MVASMPGIGRSAEEDSNETASKETNMPYVDIKITREGTAPGATETTAQQKAAIIQGVSQLLLDVLGKPLDSTFVVIQEVELDNWGVGGLPVSHYRKQKKTLQE
jgi:4-oxalocrotonate tautomerase